MATCQSGKNNNKGHVFTKWKLLVLGPIFTISGLIILLPILAINSSDQVNKNMQPLYDILASCVYIFFQIWIFFYFLIICDMLPNLGILNCIFLTSIQFTLF